MTRKFLVDLAIPVASTIGSPATGAHVQGELYADSAGTLWVCTAPGTPGTWISAGFQDPTTTVGDTIYRGALGTDQALSQSTSTSNGAGNPALVVDGNDGTNWSSGGNAGAGVWWQVDLGASKNIGAVRVFQGSDPNGYATQYTIASSVDGSSFTTRATVTGSSGSDITSNLTPVIGRYWRITRALVVGNTSGPWDLFTVAVFAAGTLVRQGIGAAGNVYQVSGGVPAWGANPLGLPLALTGATAATRYAGGTGSGPPVSGTFAKGDFEVDQTGVMWICTVAGTPGTWVMANGAAAFQRVWFR